MEKPVCSWNSAQTNGFVVLHRVREALVAAGFNERAEEFLDRAAHCASFAEMFRIARDYVDVR